MARELRWGKGPNGTPLQPVALTPVALRSLPALARPLEGISDIAGTSGRTLAVPDAARAYITAALAQVDERRPILLACPSQQDAERLTADIAAYLGEDEVALFPAWETLPFERVSPSVETMGRRLHTLWRLANRDRAPKVVVAPVRALLQRLGPHEDEVHPLEIRPWDRFDPQQLAEHLIAMGYRREHQVEHRGEFAMRGSIVDVWSSVGDAPVRLDLWDDEVERLTTFSPQDQRSIEDLDCTFIVPCRELLPTTSVRMRAEELMRTEPWGRSNWERITQGLHFEGMESWLPWLSEQEDILPDRLGDDALILLFEPRRMRDRAGELLDEEAALAMALAETWGATAPGGSVRAAAKAAANPEGEVTDPFPRLHAPFDRLLSKTKADTLTLSSGMEGKGAVIEGTAWSPVVGDGQVLAQRLNKLLSDGYRIVICAEGEGSAMRVAGALADEGLIVPTRDPKDQAITRSRTISVVVQPMEKGFVLPGVKLAVLTESDLTGRRRAHRVAKPRSRATEGFFDSLQPGGYVVHHQHGVGRFTGMERRALMGGPERDYLVIQYKDGALNLPSDQIDLIRPYTGGESPSLNRMGGADWSRTKAKVREAVTEIAQELVVLYQKRAHSHGHAFGLDTPWQAEMEELFGYVETPDQAKAIEDVKADMEATQPMDRLVCGDVGFGKTEVAIRAVFKAIQDGKQAAVLVPTTLLAQQHFTSFSERFASFPIRVEALSRFLTNAQARKVVEGLASGEVDVVIGTHRLLSKEVQFKNLGLLVIDEEQRFGVNHKEQIKQLRHNVDVLTLTATPIPRTLEMSLTGIRDLSLLNTPPVDRQPILTYVGEMDWRAVAEAIRRELLREGQVFYVHNRVMDIDQTAEKLRELVPEARVAVAHGQMDEGTLEKVIIDFWDGEFDVLVCTTIIESGIDIPTVNTLVVDRADRLGLGQLHQIRGRVGRSGKRAYAYLFHPVDMALSEEAYERLKTIGEHTELGSGFKIAMRDLEIRGAGNLLGGNQSGHIAAVGYDTYVQMVTEAVAELKGDPIPVPFDTKIEVPVTANLPVDYVDRDDVRLEAYRRLAGVRSLAEVEDIRAEWKDRFGPLPEAAVGLLAVASLRAECVRIGIRELIVAKAVARISPVTLKMSQELRLRRLAPRAAYKADICQLVLPLGSGRLGEPAPTGQKVVDGLCQMLEALFPTQSAKPS